MKDDIVLSITSGGCNVLAFLLDDPRKVIALDVNPHQGYLLELKMAAFRMLSYRGNLEFFGVRPCSARVACYRRRLRPCLSGDAARFWDGQPRKIARGIIHAGRYERYMRLLRKTVVAGFGKRRLIKRMFETDGRAEREKLYREKWQGVWWKLLTRRHAQPAAQFAALRQGLLRLSRPRLLVRPPFRRQGRAGPRPAADEGELPSSPISSSAGSTTKPSCPSTCVPRTSRRSGTAWTASRSSRTAVSIFSPASATRRSPSSTSRTSSNGCPRRPSRTCSGRPSASPGTGPF